MNKSNMSVAFEDLMRLETLVSGLVLKIKYKNSTTGFGNEVLEAMMINN